MTKDEKDRTLEILFYYFFSNKLKDSKLNKVKFWQTIKELNELYNINNINIAKAVKILFDDSNKLDGLEAYYLLDKSLFSVREIVKISGIYYEKQKVYRKQLENNELKFPIKAKINDLLVKRSIKDFIRVIYDFSTYFTYIDSRTVDNLF